MTRQEAYDKLSNYITCFGSVGVEYLSDRDGDTALECLNVLMYENEKETEKNRVYEAINVRLNNKKVELLAWQERFGVMWENEKASECFERNAINELLVMQQLKTQIEDLELLEVIVRQRRERDKH